MTDNVYQNCVGLRYNKILCQEVTLNYIQQFKAKLPSSSKRLHRSSTPKGTCSDCQLILFLKIKKEKTQNLIILTDLHFIYLQATDPLFLSCITSQRQDLK